MAMSAIERLRELLDERGVEHYAGTERTLWVYEQAGEMHGLYRFAADDTRHGFLSLEMFRLTPEQAIAAMLGPKVDGSTSDGYHTFDELYHHRAILFSVIVRDHPDIAWKSRTHHDGTMYDGMFIVGIDTPNGQATYHYDIDPYWDIFECKEVSQAPEWDGHTPDEAIERIATLGPGTCTDEGNVFDGGGEFCCSECGCVMRVYDADGTNNLCTDFIHDYPRYCPECGRKVVNA